MKLQIIVLKSLKNSEVPDNVENKIPTEEIKKRVLFSDAIEKSIKNPINNEEEESDLESDNYSEIDEDSKD